ncbi:MAG: TonB-dependent receptor, partial [Spartobacteria bacterium]
FKKNVRLYVYPVSTPEGELVTCENFRPAEGMELLYQHLRAHGLIRSIEGYDAANLEIRSPRVLDMIETGDADWEKMVPPEVVRIIKERGLFGAGQR